MATFEQHLRLIPFASPNKAYYETLAINIKTYCLKISDEAIKIIHLNRHVPARCGPKAGWLKFMQIKLQL